MTSLKSLLSEIKVHKPGRITVLQDRSMHNMVKFTLPKGQTITGFIEGNNISIYFDTLVDEKHKPFIDFLSNKHIKYQKIVMDDRDIIKVLIDNYTKYIDVRSELSEIKVHKPGTTPDIVFSYIMDHSPHRHGFTTQYNNLIMRFGGIGRYSSVNLWLKTLSNRDLVSFYNEFKELADKHIINEIKVNRPGRIKIFRDRFDQLYIPFMKDKKVNLSINNDNILVSGGVSDSYFDPFFDLLDKNKVKYWENDGRHEFIVKDWENYFKIENKLNEVKVNRPGRTLLVHTFDHEGSSVKLNIGDDSFVGWRVNDNRLRFTIWKGDDEDKRLTAFLKGKNIPFRTDSKIMTSHFWVDNADKYFEMPTKLNEIKVYNPVATADQIITLVSTTNYKRLKDGKKFTNLLKGLGFNHKDDFRTWVRTLDRVALLKLYRGFIQNVK